MTHRTKTAKETELLTKESSEHRALNYSAVNTLDTVRAFGAVPFYIVDAKKVAQSLTLLAFLLIFCSTICHILI